MASAEATDSWHPAHRPNAASDVPTEAFKVSAKAEPEEEAEAETTATVDTTLAEQHEELFSMDDEDGRQPAEDAVTPRADPADPVDPVDPVDPIDPTNCSDPIDPTNCSDPIDPTNCSADPLDSISQHHPADLPSSPPATSDASKHFSTISFTRTVANDVNWDADDDEAEWSLPRSDSDPFHFMASNDRTNSFPVVPPLETHHTADASAFAPVPADVQETPEPLAASQAMAIIAEVQSEIDQDLAEVAGAPVAAEADNGPASGSAELYIGGSMPAAAEQDSEARFAEGVPLIPHDVTGDGNGNGEADLFGAADDDAEQGDDGFFGHVAAMKEEPTLGGLERKSTLQVMQSITVGSLQRGDSDLSAMAEEDETAAEAVDKTASPEKGTGDSTDLAAQWAAALAEDDDDELLLEDSTADSKAVDPAAFFGDDDEGFLEDEDASPLPEQQASAAETASHRYVPQNAQTASTSTSAQQPANPYLPVQAAVSAPAFAPPGQAPKQFPVHYGYDAPPPSSVLSLSQSAQGSRPNTAQSFADKSKDGYQSPYDLPMDLVKPAKPPRKRQSMQQLSRPNGGYSAATSSTPPIHAPPVRGSSLNTTASIPPASSAAAAPPPGPGPAPTAPAPPLSRQNSFFEELPVVAKPRPASRHSQASPAHASPYAAPPPLPMAMAGAPPHPAPPTSAPLYAAPPVPDVAKLVAPPRVSPYAPMQSSSLAAPPPGPLTSTRYSPSPNGAASQPPLAPSRYSPAPPSRTPSGGYAPVPGGGSPAILPHQPRTSSPLAHFEISYDKQKAGAAGGHPIIHGEGFLERRGSSSLYEPRLNRVPSLPPTREVIEENTAGPAPAQLRPASSGGPYSPQRLRHTPPPAMPSSLGQALLSPPKRALNYAPQTTDEQHQHPHQHPHQQLPPPPLSPKPPTRSLTQSPGTLNRMAARATEPAAVRDISPTYAPMAAASSLSTSAPSASSFTIPSRPRAASQSLQLVPPTDGTEQDPLQRWKGAPVFSWGVGGLFVASFPQDVPRYGINQALPMIHRAPGEVQIKNMRELQPLEERLAKFPGPLKGKSKKKEVLAWLTAGIEDMERAVETAALVAAQPFRPLAATAIDPRLEERALLWGILRVFVEHDGVLEGTPAVVSAVRDVLLPADAAAAVAADTDASSNTGGFGGNSFTDVAAFTTAAAAATSASPSSGQTAAEGVDLAVLERIRTHLLHGDKEKAVWDAADKRLWGHALLVAGAASRDLFKQVAQEFVRKEVNTPGSHNESLAALYDVLAGNHDECVDELVPVHARAGLQLMTTTAMPTAAGSSDNGKDAAAAGLDKWRETLCMVLSNRSPDDVQAMHSLGGLLAGYGRVEAAHICYLFARSVAVMGGLDDPAAAFVLLGADHQRQPDALAKDTDALLLSEVYEYGLSLGGAAAVAGSAGAGAGAGVGGASASASASAGASAAGCPHLAAYKLQHALTLAEYGFGDRAQQYCDAIVAAMVAQTRRSPYHHAVLEAATEELLNRLKQAPREDSGSWIRKPSMNKVSDTVWNRFNKFVAGDDNDGGAGGGGGGGGGGNGSLGGGGGDHGSDGYDGGMGGVGPFARIASGTPTISRPPSAGGPATGMEMFGGMVAAAPHYPFGMANGGTATTAAPINTRAASRYAPGSSTVTSPYAPGSSTVTSPYEPGSAGSSYTPMGAGSFGFGGGVPVTPITSSNPYEPTSYTPSSGRASMEHPAGGESMAPGPASAGLGGFGHHYTPQEPLASSPGYSSYAANGSTAPPGADAGYQAPSYGYEPPLPGNSGNDEPPLPGNSGNGEATTGTTAAENEATTGEDGGNSGYEPPSFQPYSYEPPSYGDDALAEDHDDGETKPKKKSFMDDDDDDMAPQKPAEKTREERDRENAEKVRRIAEEEAKRAEAEQAAKAKKGWGFTSWFGGAAAKKEAPADQHPTAVKANLGEKSSFYFDPELKRWVNKKSGPDDGAAKSMPPPPPPRASSAAGGGGMPPPPMPSIPPRLGGGPNAHRYGSLAPSASVPNLAAAAAMGAAAAHAAAGGGNGAEALGMRSGSGGPPLPPLSPMMMMRSASNTSVASMAGSGPPSGPPSRPTTSMSDANSIDDLLAATGPRKAGAKKSRKGGRYVDVMAK